MAERKDYAEGAVEQEGTKMGRKGERMTQEA